MYKYTYIFINFVIKIFLDKIFDINLILFFFQIVIYFSLCWGNKSLNKKSRQTFT